MNAPPHNVYMDVIETLQRIKDQTGWKQEVLAERLGVSQATVSRWEGGSDPRGENRDRLRELALEILTASNVPAWLINGEQRVPLVSWVSAGALAAPDAVLDTSDCRKVTAPNLGEGDWIALEVDGTSMDRISPPGSLIFVNRRDRRLVLNACYVIVEPDTGEATYKRYRAKPNRFDPVSTIEGHDSIFFQPETDPQIVGRVRLSMILM